MAKGKYEEWLTKEKLTLLGSWARDGLTDEQIAHNMGISRSTLNEWKKKYPDISDTLKRGKEIVDIQVENALLRRALGYKYKEITRERIIDTGQKKRHGGESELTEEEWEFAINYFDNKCCYCGKYMKKPTKDHIRPLDKGGTLSRMNILPCCQSCNSSKKDNEWMSWYQHQKFYSVQRIEKILDYVNLVTELVASSKDDNGKMVITKEVVKEVVPDTTAQIFWLKNRRPDKWRDRPVPVNEEVYEDDGLLAALDAQIEDMEDDSWMLEDENEDS